MLEQTCKSLAHTLDMDDVDSGLGFTESSAIMIEACDPPVSVEYFSWRERLSGTRHSYGSAPYC